MWDTSFCLVPAQLERYVMKKNSIEAAIVLVLPVLLAFAALAWLWHDGVVRRELWVSEEIQTAQDDYATLAAKVAEHNHLAGGVSTWQPEKDVRCSSFLWMGKVNTATHCRPIIPNPATSEPDPWVELNDEDATRLAWVEGQHPAFTADLYEIGLECSPDLRWWGQTTGTWTHLSWEDVVVQRRANRELQTVDAAYSAYIDKDLPLARALLTRWVKASSQVEYCVPLRNGGWAQPGDSGGPLLAGDEPIGALSIGGAVMPNDGQGTCWTGKLAEEQLNPDVRRLKMMIE